MTPDQAINEAQKGSLRPVYLVMGEERWLVDRVVTALRQAVAKEGIAGFNEDKFTAGETSVEAILNAARMMPMMAPCRMVLVRGVDRWEKKETTDDESEDAAPTPKGKAKADRKSKDASPLDTLAEYAKAPVPSAVLVLVANKLHGQRRLVTTAKKGDFLVLCEPLSRQALPGFIVSTAREHGNPISHDVADHLAELVGPELGFVVDAIDRLSLYVGPKQPITEDAVAEVVIRLRQSTVWELLDALSHRRLDRVLLTLPDVLDPRSGGALRLLGSIAWSVRGLAKFESALASGASPNEAAQRAGVPPFKVGEVTRTVRNLPRGALTIWLQRLAEADLALKGSKRSAQAILETMLLDLCAAR